MRKPLVLIISVSAGLAIASSARAQCDVAQRRATGNRPDVRLGRSVSIAGDAAVFGAPGDGETARFPPYARGMLRDFFGISVAVSGDTVLIGANGVAGSGIGTGAAYIFQFADARWVRATPKRPPRGVRRGRRKPRSHVATKPRRCNSRRRSRPDQPGTDPRVGSDSRRSKTERTSGSITK